MARRGSRSIRKIGKPVQPKGGNAKKERVARVIAEPPQEPTAAMMARVEFEFGDVNDETGTRVGRAYKRVPLYVTMHRRDTDRFTSQELEAMRQYRAVFDRANKSPVGSTLANAAEKVIGSGGSSSRDFIPANFGDQRRLTVIERALGYTLSTMRAVVLHDMSFSEIAIERFGGRKRSWIRVDEPATLNGRPMMANGEQLTRSYHREDIVPRSGRHRQSVADEFNKGLRFLVNAAARRQDRSVVEVWIVPAPDGTATIESGSVAPNELFRMWGYADQVRIGLMEIWTAAGETLTFVSYDAAHTALLNVGLGLFHAVPAHDQAA